MLSGMGRNVVLDNVARADSIARQGTARRQDRRVEGVVQFRRVAMAEKFAWEVSNVRAAPCG